MKMSNTAAAGIALEKTKKQLREALHEIDEEDHDEQFRRLWNAATKAFHVLETYRVP